MLNCRYASVHHYPTSILCLQGLCRENYALFYGCIETSPIPEASILSRIVYNILYRRSQPTARQSLYPHHVNKFRSFSLRMHPQGEIGIAGIEPTISNVCFHSVFPLHQCQPAIISFREEPILGVVKPKLGQ